MQINPDGTVTPLDDPLVAAAKAKHLKFKYGDSYAAPEVVMYEVVQPVINDIVATPVEVVVKAEAVPEKVLPKTPVRKLKVVKKLKVSVAPSKPVAAPAPAPSAADIAPYLPQDIAQPILSQEVAAHHLARAEGFAMQAGGLYAQVFGNDPMIGLVRHASGAITPAEPAANIQARIDHYNALRFATGV